LLSLLLLTVAGIGGTASAATVSAVNVISPGKRISCWAVVRSTEIECTAPYLPDIGELDTYLAVRSRGAARISERGDYPGFSAPPRTLQYGDTWKRPGIRCTMSKTALTCRNLEGHGFHIQRSDVRRF
jgi:Family of unknown function (DUF6636)